MLQTDNGTVRIEGELVMPVPHGAPGDPEGFMPPLTQSIVRYKWDGEEAFGMMERSNLAERVAPYPGPK